MMRPYTAGPSFRRRILGVLPLMKKPVVLLAIALLGAGRGPGEEEPVEKTVTATRQDALKSPDLAPTGRGHRSDEGFAKPGTGNTNGISYHGGPVMLGHDQRLLHLVRQLVRQHRHHDPDRLRSAASAARRTTTSTPPTTTARTCTCRNSVTLRRADHRQLLAGHLALTDAQIQAVVASAISSGRAAQGHQRRVLRADLRRRHREPASAPSTAAGTPTAPSRAPTSSTPSSATRTAARRRARSRPPAPTATRAPTAWHRSSRTSSRRRSPTPT